MEITYYISFFTGQHKRAPSSSSGAEVDSDDNDSNVSCDSLTSGKVSPIITPAVPSEKSSLLPQVLLQDIRQRNNKLTVTPKIDEKPYDERKKESEKKKDVFIDPDSFYNFHINEHSIDSLIPLKTVVENDTFAGHRDLLMGDGAATIRSAKGTVRGVKNRVRAGIATFLQINNTNKVSTDMKLEGRFLSPECDVVPVLILNNIKRWGYPSYNMA